MFSILHVTDLHRSRTDPISNSELVSALLADRDRYERETPRIRPPDAIVVSGDLIQGVPLGTPDFELELGRQYDVASDFLVQLADRFLDGDRSRVVIVPGNHDVDWNTARRSMEVVSEADVPRDLLAALHEPGSTYRWDWKTRRLYRIVDQALYARRLDAFWTCFERFYSGVPGMPSVRPGADANLYSLDEGRIGVAAFNSCVENDCYSFVGAIPREAVARSDIDLRDMGHWRLRVAVWHHDIEGPPNRVDYMDADIVRGMIGRGYRLGLYGHQHRAQVAPHHARLLDDETMAIASAGSLCAGRWDLPTGQVRGYSIVEIRDDYAGARVHAREMGVANLFSKAVLRDFQGRSYVDLEWTPTTDAAGRREDPVAAMRIARLREAEDAFRGRGDPHRAIDVILAEGLQDDPFGRRLLVAAAQATGDPSKLTVVLGEPRTIEELVMICDAHVASDRREHASSILTDHAERLMLPTSLRRELAMRIKPTNWGRQ